MKEKWNPPTKHKAKTEMTKREFVVQYVISRANTHLGGLEGRTAAKEAIYAWEVIEKECKK